MSVPCVHAPNCATDLGLVASLRRVGWLSSVLCNRLPNRCRCRHEQEPRANFTERDGNLMMAIGSLECGKSTLRRTVAGLESMCSGTLRIGEQVVNACARCPKVSQLLLTSVDAPSSSGIGGKLQTRHGFLLSRRRPSVLVNAPLTFPRFGATKRCLDCRW